MKVGMIFECGPGGADKKVCEHLARQLLPDIEIIPRTLDDKKNLIAECGTVAEALLQDGCERIVIVWDLFPPWREKGQKPCRKEDRKAICNSLSEAGIALTQIYLVCIEAELEAWLIADGRAISSVLSTPAHAVRVKDVKKPERAKNPKKHLNKVFKEKTGRPYNDLVHAEKIVKALPDFQKIKRCSTFVRFALKATDKDILSD